MTDAVELAQASPDGPIAFVGAWLRSILHDDDYRHAWGACTFEFRLARAQAWIWANCQHPLIEARDRDELAARLVAADPGEDLWDPFAASELAQMREGFADSENWGAGTHPRPVDLDHELVMLLDTGSERKVFENDTLVMAKAVFTIRSTRPGWHVASLFDRLPIPGWPPYMGD